jgi:hypothetical protein
MESSTLGLAGAPIGFCAWGAAAAAGGAARNGVDAMRRMGIVGKGVGNWVEVVVRSADGGSRD